MRIRVGLPAVAIALVLVADVVLLTQRDQSTAVSLDAAVQGFRASQASDPGVEAAGAAAADPSAPIGGPPTAPAATAAASTVPSPAAPSPTAAPAATAPFRVPAEGVYSYRTRGYEEVSLGGGRHDYPERSYATVRAKGGCDWDFEHRVLEEHVERRLHCSAPGQVSQKNERAEITFFGQANVAEYTCDPPLVVARVGDGPGSKLNGTCRSNDGQFTVTTTFVGRERLTVGGVAVDALHLFMESVSSGRGEGTTRNDVWLHPDTGLMLKSIRKGQTRAKAYGTTIDYREDSVFELERLDPAR